MREGRTITVTLKLRHNGNENATPWRTAAQAASRGLCSEKTIYRAVRAGKLRAARLGRDLRFRDEWIDAWLETSAAPVLFVAARERAS